MLKQLKGEKELLLYGDETLPSLIIVEDTNLCYTALRLVNDFYLSSFDI